MPDPSGFSLPPFPSLYSAKEAKRLKELETQRADMQKVYQANFTDTAWSNKNPVEKIARNLPVVNSLVNLVTPPDVGWSYGYTPSQYKEKETRVETEFQELSRKQKVSSVLPDIQSHMIASAMVGKPLTSIDKIVPEGLTSNFNQADKDYLEAMGRKLAISTPEEIISGTWVMKEPTDAPADYAGFGAKLPNIAPNVIMSTVAFSNDVNKISDALKQAYPPKPREVPEPEKPKPIKTTAEYAQVLKDRAKEIGADILDTDSVDQISAKINKKLEDTNQGSILVMTDQASGKMFAANKRKDNSIWYGTDYLGFYDDKLQKLVPGDFEESKAKDVWDALVLGTNEAVQGTLMFGVDYLPNLLFGNLPEPKEETTASQQLLSHEEQVAQITAKYTEKFKAIGLDEKAFFHKYQNYNEPGAKEVWDAYEKEMANLGKTDLLTQQQPPIGFNKERVQAYNSWATQMRDQFKVVYSGAQKEHQNWLEAHPELAPRKEWADGSSHYTDPAWYFYKVNEVAPMTIASLAVMTATTVLTKNPIAGMAAGFALEYPSVTEDVFRSTVEAGASEGEAAVMSASISPLIAALDSTGDIPILRATSPVLMKMFKKELVKETVALTRKQLIKKGITTFVESEVTETATEVLQQAIQNAGAKVFNPDQRISENLGITARDTLIGIVPFSFFGGAVQISSEWKQARRKLPANIQRALDVDAAEIMRQGGLSEDQIEDAQSEEAEDGENVYQAPKVMTREEWEESILKLSDEEYSVLADKRKSFWDSATNEQKENLIPGSTDKTYWDLTTNERVGLNYKLYQEETNKEAQTPREYTPGMTQQEWEESMKSKTPEELEANLRQVQSLWEGAEPDVKTKWSGQKLVRSWDLLSEDEKIKVMMAVGVRGNAKIQAVKAQAEVQAYNKLVATDAGQAQVEVAVDKSNQVVPENRTNIKKKIDKLNETIDANASLYVTTLQSIEVQNKELKKASTEQEAKDVQETIDNLKAIIEDITIKNEDHNRNKHRLEEALHKIPMTVEEKEKVDDEQAKEIEAKLSQGKVDKLSKEDLSTLQSKLQNRVSGVVDVAGRIKELETRLKDLDQNMKKNLEKQKSIFEKVTPENTEKEQDAADAKIAKLDNEYEAMKVESDKLIKELQKFKTIKVETPVQATQATEQTATTEIPATEQAIPETPAETTPEQSEETKSRVKVVIPMKDYTETPKEQPATVSEEEIPVDKILNPELTPDVTGEVSEADLQNFQVYEPNQVLPADEILGSNAKAYRIKMTKNGVISGFIEFAVGDKYVVFGTIRSNQSSPMDVMRALGEVGRRSEGKKIITTGMTDDGWKMVQNMERRGYIKIESVPANLLGNVYTETQDAGSIPKHKPVLISVIKIPEKGQLRTSATILKEATAQLGYDPVEELDKMFPELTKKETPEIRRIDENIWNGYSADEKLAKAKEAGIAKTASKLDWNGLTDVQQERLSDIILNPEDMANQENFERVGNCEVMTTKNGEVIICG